MNKEKTVKIKQRNVLLPIIVAAVTIGLIAILAIELLPLVKEVVANAGDESKMVNYIGAYGAKGVPVLVALQVLQVIVAVIPAAAIQILTGLCYGVWMGTLINLVGCVFGNILVFIAMRRMKKLLAPLLNRVRREKKQKNFLSSSRFSRIKRPEMIVFFCFLIPGIPNGIVPYVFSETGIPLSRYIIAVAAGCIPSTLICNFLGNSVSKGDYTITVIIAGVVVVIVLIALLLKKKIFDAPRDA